MALNVFFSYVFRPDPAQWTHVSWRHHAAGTGFHIAFPLRFPPRLLHKASVIFSLFHSSCLNPVQFSLLDVVYVTFPSPRDLIHSFIGHQFIHSSPALSGHSCTQAFIHLFLKVVETGYFIHSFIYSVCIRPFIHCPLWLDANATDPLLKGLKPCISNITWWEVTYYIYF